MSGSIAGTLSGGGGIGSPSSRSETHTPRTTGDVFEPLAVTFRIAPCVSTPPRWCSRLQAQRGAAASPVDAVDVVEPGQPAVEKREVGIDQVRDAEVLAEHRLQIRVRLVEHRVLHDGVEIGIQLARRAR